MAIVQSGITLVDELHSGRIVSAGLPDFQLHRRVYFGLRGESHVVGEQGGQDLACQIVFDTFATALLLQAAVDVKQALAGNPLTGDVIQTIGGVATTYENCTFLGFEATSPIRFDSGGGNFFYQFGFLRWRKRVPN